MSAIGDYIHMTGRRYELYGVGQYSGPPAAAYDYGKQKKLIKDKIQKQAKMENVKGFEAALNDIFNKRNNSTNESQQICAEIERVLSEQFGRTMGKVDWSTGDVRKRLFQGRTITEKVIKVKANQKTIELREILNKIKSIENMRNSIRNTMQAQVLTSRINIMYNDLNFILNQVRTGSIQEFAKNVVKIPNRQLSLMGAVGEVTRSLIEDVNSVLKAYSVTPALDIQKDDLFEYAVALVPAASKLKGGQQLEEELHKIQAEANARNTNATMEIQFDKAAFSDHLVESELNFDTYATDASTRTSVTFATAYDKTDITIGWEGTPITAALKNMSIGDSNFKILKSYPMLLLLQTEDSEFVNHYLNTIATHVDKVYAPTFNIAHETMKYTAIFRALSDTVLNSNASIFIINDISTGKIKVFSIGDILTKIEQGLDNLIDVTIDNMDIREFRLLNNKEISWQVRISQLMNRLHARKITVSISPVLLK